MKVKATFDIFKRIFFEIQIILLSANSEKKNHGEQNN